MAGILDGGQGGGLLDIFRMMQSVPMQQPQGFPDALPPNAQPTAGIAPQQPMQPAPQTMQMPQQGFMGGLSDGIANNAAMLMALGGGMMSGGIGKGLSAGALAQLNGHKGSDDIREYEYAKRQGFAGSLSDWMQRKRAGAGEYGLQPVWGTDAEGNPAAVQLGKGGDATLSRLPKGFKIARDPQKIDLGTHWGIMDPQTRTIGQMFPKNIEGREAAEKQGAAMGQARVGLPAAETTSNRAMRMLDELEKHPGFSEGTGFLLGRLPALTPKAADFRERVEQVDSMVFGDAVEVMRGLGALTDKEGPRITAARARLKTAKSEEDFRTALKDVREVFREGIENMRKRAGVSSQAAPSTAPAANPAPADPLGIR